MLTAVPVSNPGDHFWQGAMMGQLLGVHKDVQRARGALPCSAVPFLAGEAQSFHPAQLLVRMASSRHFLRELSR